MLQTKKSNSEHGKFLPKDGMVIVKNLVMFNFLCFVPSNHFLRPCIFQNMLTSFSTLA